MRILIDTNVILVLSRNGNHSSQIPIMRSMPDFEDAVVDAVAERNGAGYILTRNIKDFSGSSVPAITPTEFLNILL